LLSKGLINTITSKHYITLGQLTLTIFSAMFPYPLQAAAYGGHGEIINYLAAKQPGWADFAGHRYTVIDWAGRAGHYDLIDLARSPSWDRFPETFETPQEALRMVLLYYTKSVNILRRYLPILKQSIAEYDSRVLPTRLSTAAEHGLQNMVRYLLEELNVPPDDHRYLHDNGTSFWRPISAAAKNGHREVVLLLLNAGAVFSRALEAAAMGGFANVVRLLLEHGPTEDAVAREALRRAIERQHDDVVRLLDNFGVKLEPAARSEAMRKAKEHV
jgi:ankyrin repeat protein